MTADTDRHKTHTIIAHHGDNLWGCAMRPEGKLARIVAFLMFEAFLAEGGEFRVEGTYKIPATPMRYLAFDATGKELQSDDERTAAQMGLGEETHIYLLLPEEIAA